MKKKTSMMSNRNGTNKGFLGLRKRKQIGIKKNMSRRQREEKLFVLVRFKKGINIANY